MKIIHRESFEDIRTIHDALYMYDTAFIDDPLPAPRSAYTIRKRMPLS